MGETGSVVRRIFTLIIKVLGWTLAASLLLMSIGLTTITIVGSIITGLLCAFVAFLLIRKRVNGLFDISTSKYDKIATVRVDLAQARSELSKLDTEVSIKSKQLAALRVATTLALVSTHRMDLPNGERQAIGLDKQISTLEIKAKRLTQMIEIQEKRGEELNSQEEQAGKHLSELNTEIHLSHEQMLAESKRFDTQVSVHQEIRQIVANHFLRAVDTMEGHDFEHYCGDLLDNAGFSETRVTVGSGDQGLDIITKIDNQKVGIQCKNYSQPVGNKAVQEALAGKIYYNLDAALVLTNSSFTPEARNLARKANITLWGRGQLSELIYAFACQTTTEDSEKLVHSIAQQLNVQP